MHQEKDQLFIKVETSLFDTKDVVIFFKDLLYKRTNQEVVIIFILQKDNF